MSPAFIIEALTNGIMESQGLALSAEQRVSLAEFLSGRIVSAEILMAGRCEFPPSPFSPEGSMFNGWGASVENWRFQPEPGISAAQLGRLELKWAFGIPGVVTMFGQPSLAAEFSSAVKTGCLFARHADRLLFLGLCRERRREDRNYGRPHWRSKHCLLWRSPRTRLRHRRRNWRDSLESDGRRR
jgi:hypothetical protein